MGDIYQAPDNCHGTFSISRGYRKIPGNNCVNGSKFDPIIINCPSSFLATLGKILFILSIGGVLVGVLILVFNKNFFQNALEFAQGRMQQDERGVKKSDYANLVNKQI
jgi:hypothetical protein